MDSEGDVRNPDLLTIVLLRYYLETCSRLSLKKLTRTEGNEEFCELMDPVAEDLVNDEQAEFVLNHYVGRPGEMMKDIEDLFEVVKQMVLAAENGAVNVTRP